MAGEFSTDFMNSAPTDFKSLGDYNFSDFFVDPDVASQVSGLNFTSESPYKHNAWTALDAFFTPEQAQSMTNMKGGNFNYNNNGKLVTVSPLSDSFRTQGGYGRVPVGVEDNNFSKLVDIAAPMAIGWGFGGGLSSLFGGGVTGGALGHGLANGAVSYTQGGDFGKGFLGGAIGGGLQGLAAGTPAVMGNNPSAYVPGTPGTSIAGLTGVTNPIAAGMVNRGAGSFLGSLATGSNGSDALKSGLTGAALSGLNSAGKGAMDFMGNAFKGLMSPEGSTPDYSMGDTSYGSNYNAPGQGALREAGLYPEMSNVPPSSGNFQTLDTMGLPSLNENPMMNASYASDYHPGGSIGQSLRDSGIGPQMSYAPPSMTGADAGGSDFLSSFSSGASPQQYTQSAGQPEFSLASIFGNAGSGLGRSAMSNMGDLASMLYGFYNNRKQQKALGQQISSLKGLYGQNSPYATQLRNTLNARAAQTGRRSNVAGRETQFQAQLADRAASMAPTLMQLNQAKGGLQNNNMNLLLQGMNKLGGWKKLGDLFGGGNALQDNFSLSNNLYDYNSLGTGQP